MHINLNQYISFLKIPAIKCPAFLTITFLSVIGLTACGGGSGESEEQKAIINNDNAISIVEVVASVAMGDDEFVDFVNLPESNMLSDVSNPDALEIATEVGLSRLEEDAVSYVQIEKQTLPCAGGGSVTIWGNIADPTTLTANDVINIDSDKCDDDVGKIVDGLLKMTITSIEGNFDTSEFLLGVEVIFTNLKVTENTETTALNGDISLTLDMLTPEMNKVNISGNSLTISAMGKTQSLLNFSNTNIVDSGELPIIWTHNSLGTVGNSSEFEGTVSFETPVKFEGAGATYPHTGELLITGTNNATLRLIAIDDVNVQIDADYDGDGVLDHTWYMTWAELEN